MLDKLLFLVALAGTAVVFADVLVREGMLLQPVQRWLRESWRGWVRRKLAFFLKYIERIPVQQRIAVLDAFDRDPNYQTLDEQWWWKPLWGCFKCVAGQWGFWGYLIRYHSAYSLPEHLAFTAFTIIAAIILHKWTQD